MSIYGEGSSSNLKYAVTDNLFTSAIGYIAIHNCKAGPFDLYNRGNQIYNSLQGHSLSHNQRSVDWCLPFTCGRR